MQYSVMSVRDVKASAYGRPIFTASVAAACRSFTDEVNRNHEENTMYYHPEDFALFHLGSYDDETGRFSLCMNIPV